LNTSKKELKILQFKFKETKRSAFKGFTTQYIIELPDSKGSDPKTFLVTVKKVALEKFKPQTKVRMILRTRMENAIPAVIDKTIVEVRNFHSQTEIVLEPTNLDELWNERCEQVLANLATFEMSGSGWTFGSVLEL